MSEANSQLTQNNIVAFLEDIFERRGGEEYLGESVTMAEHMLQGASMAEQNNDKPEIIVAALLHDIGHFTSEFGMFTMQDEYDRNHEEAGAQVLERFFPSVVTDCVRYHVAAKRYLCATNPNYLSQLSDASVHSLQLQGGPMSKEEASEFEKYQNLNSIIKVRLLDDAAKDANKPVLAFSHFSPLVQEVVDNHMAS